MRCRGFANAASCSDQQGYRWEVVLLPAQLPTFWAHNSSNLLLAVIFPQHHTMWRPPPVPSCGACVPRRP